MERTFIDDAELAEIQALHAYAQAKAQEARLAQLMLDGYIRLAAARHGLDPEGRYALSPRGELLPLEDEHSAASGQMRQGLAAPVPDASLDPGQEGC